LENSLQGLTYCFINKFERDKNIHQRENALTKTITHFICLKNKQVVTKNKVTLPQSEVMEITEDQYKGETHQQ
jgi:hypothetical protein